MTSRVNFPLSYNAVIVRTAGAPLEEERKEISSLGSNEVLIQTAYSSVNYMDPGLSKRNLFNVPEPYVLGFDFSGTIVALGEGQTNNLKLGDKVFGQTHRGKSLGNGFAEYVVVDSVYCVHAGNVPLREASTYGVAYLSAYEPLCIEDDLSKRKGQTIFIPGGGGGVGHFAVQLAKMNGLIVIASAGKPDSLGLLKQMGVDHIIDYNKQDVVEEVLKLTGGKGVDIVYDATYKQQSFTQSASCVAANGTWIRLGSWGQHVDESEARKIVESRSAKSTYGDLGRYWSPEFKSKVPLLIKGLEVGVELYEKGKVRPYITETVPLNANAIQDLFDRFSKGSVYGKVVVQAER